MYLFVQATCDALEKYQVVLMTVKECFFKWKFRHEDKAERLIEYGPGRIETIIKCSKIYHDGKHQQLEENLHENGDFTITRLKNCVSTYTSVIQRYLKSRKHNLHISFQRR